MKGREGRMGCCFSEQSGNGFERREPLIDLDDGADSVEMEWRRTDVELSDAEDKPTGTLAEIRERLRLEDGAVHFNGHLGAWGAKREGAGPQPNTSDKKVENIRDGIWRPCYCVLDGKQLSLFSREENTSPDRIVGIRRLVCRDLESLRGTGNGGNDKSPKDNEDENKDGLGDSSDNSSIARIMHLEEGEEAYEFTLKVKSARPKQEEQSLNSHSSSSSSSIRFLAPNYIEYRLWLKAVMAVVDKKSAPYQVCEEEKRTE